jgi:large subunit ribosomal protein L9
MKVILLGEVKGQGREGDVIDVARGFAVNYLFPRKLAVQATSGNLKQLDSRKGNIAVRETARRSEAEQSASTIEGKKVVVEAKAGDGGRLFGSVTATMIAEAIGSQLGVDVDRRRMDVHGHIKTVGEFPVTVQVYADVRAEIVVVVTPEGGAEALAAAEPAAEVAEPAVVVPDAEQAAEDLAVEENPEAGGADDDADDDQYDNV